MVVFSEKKNFYLYRLAIVETHTKQKLAVVQQNKRCVVTYATVECSCQRTDVNHRQRKTED